MPCQPYSQPCCIARSCTKLFARLFAKLFSSSLAGVIKKQCFNTVQWQGHQCGHAGRSLVAAPRGLCDSAGFFR